MSGELLDLLPLEFYEDGRWHDLILSRSRALAESKYLAVFLAPGPTGDDLDGNIYRMIYCEVPRKVLNLTRGQAKIILGEILEFLGVSPQRSDFQLGLKTV